MLDLGELSARVVVDDSGMPAGLSRAHRRFGLFGRQVTTEAGRSGTAAGAALGTQFSSAARTHVGRAASGISGMLGGALGTIGRFGGAGVAALGAVGAAGLGMGVQVAAGNETAQIAFTTMLGSGEKAEAFLTRLKDFAATTPFEFPELQTAASSLISAGIEADKVIPIMTNLGNVTSGMGTGAEGVKRATVALQQMNAAGKITGEDLNQLRDAGIPVYDLLAKATGKSKKEIAALAQAGKLGKTELDAMMQALAGPAAQAGLERFDGLMAKQSASLAGMWSTVKDTLGQGLATAIAPLIPMLKDGLGGASAFLGRQLEKLPGILTGITDGAMAFGRSDAWGTIKSVAVGVFGAVRDGAAAVPGLLRQGQDALDRFGRSETWAAIKEAGGGIGRVLRDDVLPFLLWLKDTGVPAVAAVVEWMARWRGVLTPVGVALGIFGVGLGATAIQMQIMAAGGFLKWLGTLAATTRIGAAAQWALNVAMTANPIGLVVIAIAALVGGLIYAYKHSERFREIVNAVFGWLGREVPAAFGRVRDAIVGDWNKITGKFRDAKDWVVGTWKKHWDVVLAVLLGPIGLGVLAVSRNWDKITGQFSRSKDWVVGAWRKDWAGVGPAIGGAVGRGKDAVVSDWNDITRKFTSAKNWTGSTWRKGWSAVSGWMSSAVTSGQRASGRAMDAVQADLGALRKWAGSTWRRGWSAISGWMSSSVRAGRDAANRSLDNAQSDLGALRAWAGGTWRRGWSAIRRWMSDPVGSARDAVTNILGTNDKTGLRGRLSGFISAAGRIWDGLRAKMKAPITAVIGIVNSGLIGAYNWVIDKLKIGGRLSPISIKGFKGGGPTGSGMSDDEVAGVTHAHEHVWTADEVRKAGGHRPIEALRRAVRAGLRLPGYFLGGGVNPLPGASWSQHKSGYGFARWAGDGNKPGDFGALVKAYKDGVVASVRTLTGSYGKHVWINHGRERSLYAHLSSFLVKARDRVRGGDNVGRVGSTGNSTGPHLHFELRGGSGPLSAVGDAIKGAVGALTERVKASWLGKFANPADLLRDRASKAMAQAGLGGLGASGWGGVVRRVPGLLLDKAVDKAKGFAENLWTDIRSVVSKSSAGSTRGLGPRARAARAYTTDRWGITNIGGFSYRNIAGTRTLSKHAIGKAIDIMTSNVALGNEIAGYFAGSGRGKFGVDNVIWRRRIHNAGRGGWGSYRGVNPHYDHVHVDFYKRGGAVRQRGYAAGTQSAAPGFAWTGEKGAELVLNPQLRRYSGGERVLTGSQTRRAMTGQGGAGGTDSRPYIGSLTLQSSGNLHRDLDEVMFRVRSTTRGGVYAQR